MVSFIFLSCWTWRWWSELTCWRGWSSSAVKYPGKIRPSWHLLYCHSTWLFATIMFFWSSSSTSSSSTTSSSSSTRQWQSYILEKLLNWDSWCGMWQHNVQKVWSLEHLNFSGHLEWSAETMPFSLKCSSFRFWFSLKPLHCWLYDHILSICIIRPSKFQIPPKKC